MGTIIPLTGALRPLGEQTVNVMKVAVDATLNHQTHIPGPYANINWGCPSRDGVFGRHVSLKVFSLQNNTPEEALAGMRRLIDIDHVFLVRDCYLQSNLMGPAVQFENQRGVPGVWCFYSGVGPELAPWNYAPGTNPNIEVAIETAYQIEVMHKTHLAILTDPSVMNTLVKVEERVAAYLHHPINVNGGCVQTMPAQNASNGEDSQVAKIRTCYGPGVNVDAVIANDGLNLTFGALSAKNQGWRGADNGVTWVGATSDWVTTFAQLGTDALQGAITDCQALPCIPWASPVKYPAVKALQDTYNKYLRSYPEDILTYGPEAITGGLGLWLGMTGPNLSTTAFRNTLASLHNWDAGIGPVLTVTPRDHFGGAGVWLIKFTGRNNQPFFEDLTGKFLTMQDLHVPLSLART
jgi:Periplasmic binding protein